MSENLILVVDDERDILRLVEYNLLEEGYKVITAMTGQDALRQAREHRPSVIVLDFMLPGMDGREVLKILRQNSETEHIPVVVLSAKASDVDRILGFEMGCDDYIVKPFNHRELVLRIRAILRRMNPPLNKSDIIRVGDLEVDTSRHIASLDGENLDLTPTEFKLLVFLMRREGRVQTRETLLSEVWGVTTIDEFGSRTVDTHIRRLRQKMRYMDRLIKTVRKYGYTFKSPTSGLVGGPGWNEPLDETDDLLLPDQDPTDNYSSGGYEPPSQRGTSQKESLPVPNLRPPVVHW